MPQPSAPASPYYPRRAEFWRELGAVEPTRLASRTYPVQGLAMHGRSSIAPGEGLPFVLIHGLVISSLYMIPLAEYLAVRHPVHAVDLPGFGRSEAPGEILTLPQLADAVLEWMTAAGIERCHLMGNSLGCEIAAHLAVRAPERVASLVLVGPTLDPAAMAVTTQTLRLLWDAWHEPKRLWLNWAFDFFRAGLLRALGMTREMFRDHIENQLPRLQCPTVVVRGGQDPTVPQAAAETLTRLIPQRRLLVLPTEPHCAHYTAPAAVGRIMEELAAQCESPR